MNTSDPSSFLNDFIGTSSSELSTPTQEVASSELYSSTQEEGATDPRLKLLSHSSRLTLHACPRKYQLAKLGSIEAEVAEEVGYNQAVTFAYGHAVGTGIQAVMENKTEVEATLATFLAWDTGFEDFNPKQKKSFGEALFSVQKFAQLRSEGYLEDYELVEVTLPDGSTKPAVELSFCVTLPGGYSYRGYIDVVLKHTKTGEILVLELKTSSGIPNPIAYKNSGQALGYSVVLDMLFPELSSYSVLYLVYYTHGRAFSEFVFEKSLLQRALWLQELLLDTYALDNYSKFDTYPMYGESCNDFFRPCEHYGLCTLSVEHLTKPLTVVSWNKIVDKEASYDYYFDFDQLVATQVAKGTL